MKVDYYVSVECGREAGLCTPRSPSDLSRPPVPTPVPTPNPTPIPAPTPPSAPTQTSDNPWPTVGSIIFVLIASYVANKIRKKITRIIRARKYNSDLLERKKEMIVELDFETSVIGKTMCVKQNNHEEAGNGHDAYLDSLAEEFEDEWESISRSGKAAQLIQMYRDIFDNEFTRRQYEHKRPHFWERYEHKKPKEKEGERHEQKRQEREEKLKQESTIDLSKYYKILGLKPGATKEKIKARFRELTLKYHSDRGGSDDKLKEVIEAKEILLKNKKK